MALDLPFALAKQNIEAMNAVENTNTKNAAKGNSLPKASLLTNNSKIDFDKKWIATIFAFPCKWGISSSGRALAWHVRGDRFDPGILHLKKDSVSAESF